MPFRVLTARSRVRDADARPCARAQAPGEALPARGDRRAAEEARPREEGGGGHGDEGVKGPMYAANRISSPCAYLRVTVTPEGCCSTRDTVLAAPMHAEAVRQQAKAALVDRCVCVRAGERQSRATWLWRPAAPPSCAVHSTAPVYISPAPGAGFRTTSLSSTRNHGAHAARHDPTARCTDVRAHRQSQTSRRRMTP
jgi:hypothetical protein